MNHHQPDLFALDCVPEPPIGPDSERVRERLARIVAQAQAAETMPWTRSKEKLYRAIVPQLALNLSEEEGERFKRLFEREMERLQTA